MLSHGRTELSHSCQSDACRLQQLYGVMWKPNGSEIFTFECQTVKIKPRLYAAVTDLILFFQPADI